MKNKLFKCSYHLIYNNIRIYAYVFKQTYIFLYIVKIDYYTAFLECFTFKDEL